MDQKVSIFECDDRGKRILSEEIIKLFQEKGVTEVEIIKTDGGYIVLDQELDQ